MGLEGQTDMFKKVKCRGRLSNNSMNRFKEMQKMSGMLVETKGKCW